jgi:thiosulfate/3-mercaptopyruvate sulfurtransferase
MTSDPLPVGALQARMIAVVRIGILVFAGALALVGPVRAAPVMVNVAQMAPLLSDPAVIILDARGDKATFEQQRLRGARYLDWDRWNQKLDTDKGVADAEWALMLGEIGIRPSSKLLLYDDGLMGWSAMVWLALRRLGVDDVRVIPTRSSVFFKQLPAQALESGPAKPITPSHDEWEINAEGVPQIIDADSVAMPGALLFDNRCLAEFDGAAESDESGIRPGHIPRAILLPRRVFFGPDGEPVSSDAAVTLMKAFGADPARRVTLYCWLGGRSSAVALILWQAGFTDVAVYAGRWREWGANSKRPAAKR